MTLKSEIINGAYSQLRISGLTVSPTAADSATALSRLENMMAELPIDIGYNFEDAPSASSETNVERRFNHMIESNLAIRLIPDFNKDVPPTLQNQASQAMGSAIGYYMSDTARQIQPPRRMPKGSGSRWARGFIDRYQNPPALPPNDTDTVYIWEGEQFDLYEDFSAWLGANTIASYTIASDTRLTIVTSANADPRITYTVKAIDGTNILQRVKITVTDSAGRIDIRTIDFGVTDPPTVG